MSRVLYITYDGLLDPLGGSQILPYLAAFSEWHEVVMVLSFEKPSRLASSDYADLSARLGHMGMRWKPLRFTHSGGSVGKAWDLCKMYWWAAALAMRHGVDVVHGRGHPASQVGLFVKRLTKSKLIFDMRGLWADERIDKGSWDMRRLLHRLQYGYYKKTERELLTKADHLVVLTEAVVPEIRKLASVASDKLTVIPCCADFELFRLADAPRRTAARMTLDISADATVLGYLGSVGRMYMLDRLFRLFELSFAERPDIFAVVLTPDLAAARALMALHLPSTLHSRVRIRSATRHEVAELIPAMNVLVSFIQPSYARIAASPTKVAECFAEGVPVICNPGVGDLAEQLGTVDGGLLVDPMSDDALRSAVVRLDQVCSKGGLRLRNGARALLGLEVATLRYRSVYAQTQENNDVECRNS